MLSLHQTAIQVLMISDNFPFTVSDSACIQLEMDIETDSIFSKEHIKTDTAFGVAPSDTVNAKKYIIAFLNRLLLQREKNDKNLLEAYLNPKINKLWQEVLSSLEETNRKLINFQSGSVIFTLFGQATIRCCSFEIQDGELNCKLKWTN